MARQVRGPPCTRPTAPGRGSAVPIRQPSSAGCSTTLPRPCTDTWPGGSAGSTDPVSETFLVALRQRRNYDPPRSTVRARLCGITTNLLRRHARQEILALHATALGSTPQPAPGHDSRVAERVDAAAMARQLAAAELSEQDRDVLLLTSCRLGLRRGRRGARHPAGNRSLPASPRPKTAACTGSRLIHNGLRRIGS